MKFIIFEVKEIDEEVSAETLPNLPKPPIVFHVYVLGSHLYQRL